MSSPWAKFLSIGLKAQGPGVVFNVACLMKHEYRRLIALGQTRTCRNSRRRYTEKRGEYRVLAAIVLICRIPYGAACFEAFDGLTHVAAFDNAVKVMYPSRSLHV